VVVVLVLLVLVLPPPPLLLLTTAMLSQVLKPLPGGSQATWKAGSAVEVAWVQKAWHGGGYSYRLAPAGELTEATFQKMPLDFVGDSALRWGGVGGEMMPFNSSAKGWQVMLLLLQYCSCCCCSRCYSGCCFWCSC